MTFYTRNNRQSAESFARHDCSSQPSMGPCSSPTTLNIYDMHQRNKSVPREDRYW